MAGLTAFKTLVKEGITDILVGILKGTRPRYFSDSARLFL
jgi:hypothetical protein